MRKSMYANQGQVFTSRSMDFMTEQTLLIYKSYEIH